MNSRLNHFPHSEAIQTENKRGLREEIVLEEQESNENNTETYIDDSIAKEVDLENEEYDICNYCDKKCESKAEIQSILMTHLDTVVIVITVW